MEGNSDTTRKHNMRASVVATRSLGSTPSRSLRPSSTSTRAPAANNVKSSGSGVDVVLPRDRVGHPTLRVARPLGAYERDGRLSRRALAWPPSPASVAHPSPSHVVRASAPGTADDGGSSGGDADANDDAVGNNNGAGASKTTASGSASSSSSSSTISALDALLGVVPEPETLEPAPAPSSTARDAADTTIITDRASRASEAEPEESNQKKRNNNNDDDDEKNEKNRSPRGTAGDDLLGAVARALTPSTSESADAGAAGARAAATTPGRPPAADQYDPDFDPLGLGPRWSVPWSWPTLVGALVSVEASFFLAGALAPAVVYTSVREPEEIPVDDPTRFAQDMQTVFDDPSSFADIIVVAEVIQTCLALGVVAAAAAPKRPLPPGWFQFSLSGDDIETIGDGGDGRGGGGRADDAASSEKSINANTNTNTNKMANAGEGAAAATANPADERKRRAAVAAQKRRSENWLGEAGNAALSVWGLVLVITLVSYATGLRGDDTGTASNSVIEKAFAAGSDGAASLLITTVLLAPVLEETVFRGFLLPSLTRWGFDDDFPHSPVPPPYRNCGDSRANVRRFAVLSRGCFSLLYSLAPRQNVTRSVPL